MEKFSEAKNIDDSADDLDMAFVGYFIFIFGAVCTMLSIGASPHTTSENGLLLNMLISYVGWGMVPFGIIIYCIGKVIRKNKKM